MAEIAAAGKIIALGIAAIGGLVAAGFWIVGKINQKKISAFKESLTNYVSAVNEQSLTEKHIDDLINAMDAIKHKEHNRLKIEFSSGELAALVECLCNHTKTLAYANNIELKEKYTKKEQEDILLKLRKNLVFQKNILQEAA